VDLDLGAVVQGHAVGHGGGGLHHLHVALALQALAGANIASSGTESATQALAGLVAGAGQSVQDARRDADVLGAAESQASAMRASVSGVNTDDEMVSLTQFQRAYDASLKVVQVADQMLQDLIAMKR